MISLRPYQSRAIARIQEEWKEHRSTLFVAATGTGKTTTFVELIRRMQPARALVVAHREELIFQIVQRVEEQIGLDCQIEMADFSASRTFFSTPVIAATVQTLCSRNRMQRFSPNDFGLLIIDECFIPGTLIDGMPIESIVTGNCVTTHLGIGSVTHVLRNTTRRLVRLRFSNGRETVCTPTHPFYTIEHGFIPASCLTINHAMVSITHEQVCNLRQGNEKQVVLVGSMQVGALASDDIEKLQETWRRDYEVSEAQRHERSGSESTGIDETSGDGMEADGSRRQRASSHDSTVGSGVGSRMEDGSRYPDQEEECLSDLLQGGYWKLRSKNSDRSGREFSQFNISTWSGREERRVIELVRLESIEILEPGSNGEFERLCPGGVVYNLEVDNGNTYCANGILVHNCHHATAESYRKIIEYFSTNPDLKIVGCTATPDRTDEEALGQIFESVADEYSILDAIHDGWLVPVDQQMISIQSLDFSHVRTTAGDLNGADLARVMEAEKNLQGVCGAAIDIIGDKRTVFFTASVRHAEMACEILNRHKPGMAGWLSAKTPKEDRRKVMTAFRKGDLQVLCNVGIVSEGVDIPQAEIVIMARPTKSRSLYAQMAGRVLRPLPGLVDGVTHSADRKDLISLSAKPSALVVDFVGNSGQHKLVNAVDILSGKVSERAVAKAVELLKEIGERKRIGEVLDEAEEEIEREAEEKRQAEIARRARLVAKVGYTKKRIDPFAVLDLSPAKERGWDKGKLLSDKQRLLLLKQGVDPDGMPYHQAKQVIDTLFFRWSRNLCTLGQAKVLKRFGYDTKEMSRADASVLLGKLSANGWRRLEGVAA